MPSDAGVSLPTARKPAQVLVMFALMLPVFVLGLGMSIDLGNLLTQRREAQAAADAAALAGARCLFMQAQDGTNRDQLTGDSRKCRSSRASGDPAMPSVIAPDGSTYTPADTVPTNVNAYDAVLWTVAQNAQGSAATQVEELKWVDYDAISTAYTEEDLDASNCCSDTSNGAITSPTAANGVRVTVTRSFTPYMLQIVMGILPATGISDGNGHLIARAVAKAQVGSIATSDYNKTGPWGACGYYLPRYCGSCTDGANDADLESILLTNTTIDTSKYGREYYLQDGQMNAGVSGFLYGHDPPDCPQYQGDSWKGRVVIPPSGVNPGTTGTLVDTLGGNGNAGSVCQQAGYPSGPCYMPIPVADNQNVGLQAHITAIACFYVRDRSGNQVTGVLSNPINCPVAGTYTQPPTWTKVSGTSLARPFLTE